MILSPLEQIEEAFVKLFSNEMLNMSVFINANGL